MDAWPCQISDESGFNLWYIRPGVIVVQAWAPTGTLRYAQHLIAAVDTVREERRQEILAHGGLSILHDWRSMVGGLAGDAVGFINQSWKANIKAGDLAKVVTCMPVSRAARVAIAATNVIARLVSGIEVRYLAVDEFDAYFHGLGLQKPSADTVFSDYRERVAMGG